MFPKHVHSRGGQSLTRRLRKWTLKRSPHHSADKMWNGVSEKSATEKVRYAVIPRHVSSSPPVALNQPLLLAVRRSAPFGSPATGCAANRSGHAPVARSRAK